MSELYRYRSPSLGEPRRVATRAGELVELDDSYSFTPEDAPAALAEAIALSRPPDGLALRGVRLGRRRR
jgi:hypothetical protein